MAGAQTAEEVAEEIARMIADPSASVDAYSRPHYRQMIASWCAGAGRSRQSTDSGDGARQLCAAAAEHRHSFATTACCFPGHRRRRCAAAVPPQVRR
jgi:hypothetical protein